MPVIEPSVSYSCEICAKKFDVDSRVYGGRYLAMYQICVCRACYENNRAGWQREIEPALTSNLRDRGFALPARNSDGLLPQGV